MLINLGSSDLLEQRETFVVFRIGEGSDLVAVGSVQARGTT